MPTQHVKPFCFFFARSEEPTVLHEAITIMSAFVAVG